MRDFLPPREPVNEVRAAECSEKCTNRDTTIEYSLSCSSREINAENILKCGGFDLSEIDNAVSEVKG